MAGRGAAFPAQPTIAARTGARAALADAYHLDFRERRQPGHARTSRSQ